MNLDKILNKIFPTYRKVSQTEAEVLESRKEIERLQEKLQLIEKTLNKVSKNQLDLVKRKAIIEDSTTESIKKNSIIFESAVSNLLEQHLYNSGITKEADKDKPLFLIGSGPSLKGVDLSILKDCYTMSFNRSYIAFKDWGFEPTYFAGIDSVVNEDNKEEIKKLIDSSSIKRFFFNRDKNVEDNFSSPRTTIVQIAQPDNPNLDFTKRLRTSNTGLFGLQVALGILGFKEVYLLGCDANYVEKVEDTKNVAGKLVSTGDSDPNHFRPDYFGKGKVYNKPFADLYHYPAWKAFYEQNIKNNVSGFKVYNCSKIGRLTFFEYKDFDEISKNIKKYSIK